MAMVTEVMVMVMENKRKNLGIKKYLVKKTTVIFHKIFYQI